MRTNTKNGLATTIVLGSTVFGLALGARAASQTDVSLSNWHEECQVEGCSTEELTELYGSYSSECLDEGCSTEELNEDAGGQQYIDGMLQAFLQAGWVVSSGDFQSDTAPTGSAIWWYQGCNFTGLVTQQTGNASNLPNGFNDKTLALKSGPSVNNVQAYTEPSFAGSTVQFFSSVACLTTSFPSFANNIASAKILP